MSRDRKLAAWFPELRPAVEPDEAAKLIAAILLNSPDVLTRDTTTEIEQNAFIEAWAWLAPVPRYSWDPEDPTTNLSGQQIPLDVLLDERKLVWIRRDDLLEVVGRVNSRPVKKKRSKGPGGRSRKHDRDSYDRILNELFEQHGAIREDDPDWYSQAKVERSLGDAFQKKYPKIEVADRTWLYERVKAYLETRPELDARERSRKDS